MYKLQFNQSHIGWACIDVFWQPGLSENIRWSKISANIGWSLTGDKWMEILTIVLFAAPMSISIRQSVSISVADYLIDY